MEEHIELRGRIRQGIKELRKLSLQVSAELFPNDVIAAKINSVINTLKGNTQAASGILAQAHTISTGEKISQLDEEIQELFTFTVMNGLNQTYDPKGLEKIRQACTHLEEYRKLIEEGIKSDIKPPAYKKNLSDEAIKSEYIRLKSFRAVGEVLGCSPKTVKARLVAIGFIEK